MSSASSPPGPTRFTPSAWACSTSRAARSCCASPSGSTGGGNTTSSPISSSAVTSTESVTACPLGPDPATGSSLSGQASYTVDLTVPRPRWARNHRRPRAHQRTSQQHRPQPPPHLAHLQWSFNPRVVVSGNRPSLSARRLTSSDPGESPTSRCGVNAVTETAVKRCRCCSTRPAPGVTAVSRKLEDLDRALLSRLLSGSDRRSQRPTGQRHRSNSAGFPPAPREDHWSRAPQQARDHVVVTTFRRVLSSGRAGGTAARPPARTP